MVLTIFLALCSAFLNALSSVIQRRVAGQPDPKELFRHHFVKSLLTSKVWIGAFGLQVLAFIAQAWALRNGSLILVQPLITVDLVFLLLILHFRYRVPIGKREWLAVAGMCLGLSGLLFSTNPAVGNRAFSELPWALTIGIVVLLSAAAVFSVRRLKSGIHRAAISGMAAGLCFALVAAFTKLTTIQLHHGVVAVLTGWQLYALFAAGIFSLLMEQNTFGAGPLSASQPAMEIVEPVISATLGIILFGDIINHTAGDIAGAVVSGIAAAIGIFLMASSRRLYDT